MAIRGKIQKSAYAKQLAFIQLDTVNPDDCIELWSIVEEELDSILADFYAHLKEFSPKAMYAKMNVPVLAVRQYEHWKRLFTTFYSTEYVESARRVGLAHDEIGLSAEWYIGAYTFFLDRMTAAVFTHYADRTPDRGREMISLLSRLVGLDIAIVMSVYQCE